MVTSRKTIDEAEEVTPREATESILKKVKMISPGPGNRSLK